MKSCVALFAVDFLGRSRMKKIWWITTNVIEKIWWNNFWYLYPDINFVIDGTKWDFFSERKTSMSQDRIVFFDPFFCKCFYK